MDETYEPFLCLA